MRMQGNQGCKGYEKCRGQWSGENDHLLNAPTEMGHNER